MPFQFGTFLHISIADTVVLTYPPLGIHSIQYEDAPPASQDILEKPSSKEDNLRMLLDLNGNVCEVVTGVSVGKTVNANCYADSCLMILVFGHPYPSVSGIGSSRLQDQVGKFDLASLMTLTEPRSQVYRRADNSAL